MRRCAFTIVELIIALALVVLLAGLMIPVGARLATSRERLDLDVRRLEQIGRLFDVLDGSLATCAVDDVSIASGTLRWTQRSARPGASDWSEALGVERSMSLTTADGALVLSSGVGGAVRESVAVGGVERARMRSIASRAGEVEVQIWFADVADSTETDSGGGPGAGEAAQGFDEFGVAESGEGASDETTTQETPREPDVKRVFRLRVERVDAGGGS